MEKQEATALYEIASAPPKGSLAWKLIRAKLVELLSTRRPYVNKCEEQFFQMSLRAGWLPLRQGWPDFLCFDQETGTPIAVEVKPRGRNGELFQLEVEQGIVMDFLHAHGVECYVSDGETTEPYEPDRHVKQKRGKGLRQIRFLNRVASR